MSDIKPLDKTLVTEFKTVIADINIRSRASFATVATKIPRNKSFTQLDAIASQAVPIFIEKIEKYLSVVAHEPIILIMTNSQSKDSLSVIVNGLFCITGECDFSFTIIPKDDQPVRCSLCYT